MSEDKPKNEPQGVANPANELPASSGKVELVAASSPTSPTSPDSVASMGSIPASQTKISPTSLHADTPDTPDTKTSSPELEPALSGGAKLKKRFGRIYRIALAVAFVAIGLMGAESYRFLSTPAQTQGKMVVVEINPGDTFDKVATRLASAGAISSKIKFTLYARLRGEANQIQAGVFEFYTDWTPPEVLQQLVFGKPTLERFTLREGLPWWEVAKRIEQAGLAKAEDFKEIIHDPDFLREMGIPFNSAEGFLYPETYFLKKPPEVLDKTQARQIAARLINTFWQKTAPFWGDAKPAAQELKNLITLASLVEKETGVQEERARVAGVYANRLRLGMLLQCDPTTIYGMGESYNGNLTRKHLQDPANLYNTYQHAGLPPGPICSPGAAAIQAALEPDEHKYLYFVATGKNGTHYFNTNLQGHNRDVAKYLAELRKARQAANQAKQDSSNHGAKPTSEGQETGGSVGGQAGGQAGEQAGEQATQAGQTNITANQNATANLNSTLSGPASNASAVVFAEPSASAQVNASTPVQSIELVEEELSLSQNATISSLPSLSSSSSSPSSPTNSSSE